MEEMRITHIDHYQKEDFDELNLLVNDHSSQHSDMDPVDGEHNVYLRIDNRTDEIAGLMIVYANDWFNELADAFQRHDLDHPDVRFFLEQKITAWAERWAAERQRSESVPGSADDETETAEMLMPTP